MREPRTPRSTAPRLLAALLASALLAACTGVDDSPEARLARAREAVARHDRAAAVVELKGAIESAPELVDAHLLLASIYDDLADGASAAKHLERARSAGANGPAVAVEEMRSLLFQRRFSDVVALEAPALPEALALRGDAFYGLGQWEQARTTYEAGVAADAAHPDPQVGLARIDIQAGRAPAAAERLAAVVAAHPDHFLARVIHADLLVADRRFEDALKEYREAERLIRQSPFVHLGLARVLAALVRPAEAAPYVERLLSRYPGHTNGLYLRAVIAFQRGDVEAAKSTLTQVLTIDKEHRAALFLLSSILFQQRNYAQADEVLTRLVALDPGNLPALKLLARLRLAGGVAGRMLESLEQARTAAPDDPELLGLLGTSQLQAGEEEAGTDNLQKAVGMAPDATDLRTQLALGFVQRGEHARAIEELGRIGPDALNEQAMKLLVYALLREGRFADAAERAAAFVERQPKSPSLHNLLGTALLGQREIGGARAAFEAALGLDADFVPALTNLAALDLQGGDIASATRRYRRALELEPEESAALTALARIAAARDDRSEAESLLRRAVAAEPRDWRSAIALARLLLDGGRAADALPIVRLAATVAPAQGDVLDVQARVERATGNPEAALATYARLLEVTPIPAFVHVAVAETLAGLRRWDEAEAAIGRSLTAEAHNLQALLTQSRIAAARGDAARALDIARTAATHHPERPEPLVLEAELQAAGGRPADAVQSLRTALARFPANGIVIALHRQQRAMNDAAGAAATLADWLAAHPKDTLIRHLQAEELLAAGRRDEAREALTGLLREAPDDLLALNNLAWLDASSDPATALGHARRAYELAPNQPQVADTYGWLLLGNGQVNQALAILERAAAAAPRAPGQQYHWAAALARAGKTAEARRVLDAALAGAGPFPERAEAEKLAGELRAAGP